MSATTTIWVLILKLFAPTLLLTIINKFKKNKKMRFFDTLEQPCKTNIIVKSISFAKAENIENGFDPMTNIEELTIDYCHQLGCIVPDIFENCNDIFSIQAWVGARPNKQPR